MTRVTEPAIVLASSSPRRRELLDLIGVVHSVEPADIDESVRDSESPAEYVERLAREKATVVARRHPWALVIAADTTVVIGDQLLGKPGTEREAATMLAALGGATHTVLTGMACALNGRMESSVEDVSVTFRSLSEQEILEYVATGEPMDKAGSYGIQGYGATMISRIDGDYFAVMGLSLVRLVDLMQRLGVGYHFGGATRST